MVIKAAVESDDIYFKTGGTSFAYNGTEHLTIKGSTGNVGIGTTAPGNKLHVKGGTGQIMTLESSGGYTFDLGWAGTDFTYKNDSGSWHRFYYGGTELFTIANTEAWTMSGGRFGVGKRTS